MKAVRGLTRLLAPIKGEAFVSYIDRLASLHKVTRGVILNSVGFFDDEKFHYVRGFGIVLDNAILENFSIATRLPKHVLKKMLLSSYKGIVLGLSTVDLDLPKSLLFLPIAEWAYFTSSHMCPHCLREKHGAWQLLWKFPWTFTCIKHECYLISHCPACGLRLAQGEPSLVAPSRYWCNHIPVPGHCNNLYRDDIRGNVLLCNCNLAELPTTHAVASTLEVQKQLNGHLSEQAAMILGGLASPLEYFRDLRALCQFIMFCAESDDFEYIPLPEALAFKKFAEKRANQSTAKSDYGRRGMSPESPELMAAITRLATSILAADATTIGASLRPLTDRFSVKLRRRWTGLKSYGFSDRLAAAIIRNMESIGTFDYTVGRKARETCDTPILFGPQHVPPLLWQEEFDRSFAVFFPFIRQTEARRFCSIALVKLCGGYSWARSASELRLTEYFASTSRRGLNALRQTGGLKEFGKALREVARRLSNDPNKIDYAARRKVLSTLNEIPYAVWTAMCNEAGIIAGRIGSRNVNAAIWLWATLTASEWRMAPAVAEEQNIGTRRRANFTATRDRCYRQHCETVIPKVAPLLLAYGSKLLELNSGRR